MMENNSVRKLFDNWNKSRGHKLFEVSLPINIYNIKKYWKMLVTDRKNKRKKVYEWVYDKQFGECDCVADEGGRSDPYCVHMNKLIRIEKEC